MPKTQNNNNTAKQKFLNLWPTQFMEMSLPGHENANSVIADIVLSKNAAQENMTENYISQNILEMDHPAMFWLKQCIAFMSAVVKLPDDPKPVLAGISVKVVISILFSFKFSFKTSLIIL